MARSDPAGSLIAPDALFPPAFAVPAAAESFPELTGAWNRTRADPEGSPATRARAGPAFDPSLSCGPEPPTGSPVCVDVPVVDPRPSAPRSATGLSGPGPVEDVLVDLPRVLAVPVEPVDRDLVARSGAATVPEARGVAEAGEGAEADSEGPDRAPRPSGTGSRPGTAVVSGVVARRPAAAVVVCCIGPPGLGNRQSWHTAR
ncbi:hypothetical protein [Nocardiopsis sp. Huas11]|uniref:hypothetical protein n=1 Tax=Nocardiopsis sp. Huas11 TaxID=2183912 RepID=UPI00131506F7|nr:hypothetical protein [Nocardiopsis sp. Huas11]